MTAMIVSGSLAYALTVRKSQGMALSKTVLDLSALNFSLGLTYVVVSRACATIDLIFERSFNYQVFTRPLSDLSKI